MNIRTLFVGLILLIAGCESSNPELSECIAEADAIADRCEARKGSDGILRNLDYCEIARNNAYKYCEREHG